MADEVLPPALPARAGVRGLGPWQKLLAWRLSGLPDNLGTLQWILSASTRMPMATTAALATAWTGIIIALWVGAISAIGSVIVTAFGGIHSGGVRAERGVVHH